MSILVRYNPPSLTADQYEEGDRLLREAGVEPLPDGLGFTSASGRKATCVSAKSGTRGSSSKRTAGG